MCFTVNDCKVETHMIKSKFLFYLILLKFQLPTTLPNKVIHEVSFS